jgi:putative transposase
LTDQGRVRIDTPRDRQSHFEPQLVKKGQRRLQGLDETIVALYAGGMTTREIESYIAELYGPGVSRETVSRVTNAVLEDAQAWQTRPLEAIYPILYLDALVIKIRDGQAIRNFACYLAIGVNLEGDRDVLGMWFQRTEGAKFWLQVLTELKTRGVQDVLVCCVDGLTGFPEAIEAVFPQAWVQTCIVHAIRAALRFVPYRDKRRVAQDLKKIYTAVDRDHAERELERFAETWDAKHPMISASWIENWERIVPFLAFPPDVRRDRLHDKYDRSAQPPDPKDHQHPRQLPLGGLCPQAALPRDHPRPTEMEAHLQPEHSTDSIPHPLRRPHP